MAGEVFLLDAGDDDFIVSSKGEVEGVVYTAGIDIGLTNIGSSIINIGRAFDEVEVFPSCDPSKEVDAFVDFWCAEVFVGGREVIGGNIYNIRFGVGRDRVGELDVKA